MRGSWRAGTVLQVWVRERVVGCQPPAGAPRQRPPERRFIGLRVIGPSVPLRLSALSFDDQASIDRVYKLGLADGRAAQSVRPLQERGMANVEIFREDPSVCAFEAGCVMFAEGGPGATMYVVIEGQVDLCRAVGGVLATAGPGEVFGELALIDDRPPYFAIEVMRTMAERLRLVNAKAAG